MLGVEERLAEAFNHSYPVGQDHLLPDVSNRRRISVLLILVAKSVTLLAEVG